MNDNFLAQLKHLFYLFLFSYYTQRTKALLGHTNIGAISSQRNDLQAVNK